MRSLCDDDCKIYLMVDCHGVISCTSLIYTDGQRLLSNIGQGREYLFGSLSDRQNDVDRLTTAPLEWKRGWCLGAGRSRLHGERLDRFCTFGFGFVSRDADNGAARF